MAQLTIHANHILPARAGLVRGLEVTPAMRHAALRACGVRAAVADAIAAGLITAHIDAEARVLAQRKGLCHAQ